MFCSGQRGTSMKNQNICHRALRCLFNAKHDRLIRSSQSNIYIQGIWQTLLSKATYNKYVDQKKEKQLYISPHRDSEDNNSLCFVKKTKDPSSRSLRASSRVSEGSECHVMVILSHRLLRHGEADQGQDLPGLPGLLPPSLQLCPLPRTPGQP